MKVSSIETDKAPLPIGPYSQAVVCGDTIYISGQIPLDPETGEVAGATIEPQARQALANLKAILESQGLSVQSLVKTTVYLSDMGHFGAFNSIYETMLDGTRPARSVIAVAGLPRNVLVEIEAIACR
ncbi:MAG: RidA family protein [Chitinispirillaceae bacterium]|nr:RidA family protein [Chitinispirillaceae bacterium]